MHTVLTVVADTFNQRRELRDKSGEVLHQVGPVWVGADQVQFHRVDLLTHTWNRDQVSWSWSGPIPLGRFSDPHLKQTPGQLGLIRSNSTGSICWPTPETRTRSVGADYANSVILAGSADPYLNRDHGMSCGPYYANPVILVGSCDPQLKSGSWHDIWTLSYNYSNAAFGSYYSHVK